MRQAKMRNPYHAIICVFSYDIRKGYRNIFGSAIFGAEIPRSRRDQQDEASMGMPRRSCQNPRAEISNSHQPGALGPVEPLAPLKVEAVGL
jgi:hypothetical protein